MMRRLQGEESGVWELHFGQNTIMLFPVTLGEISSSQEKEV